MSTQLLIYERAEPISKQKHSNWSVKTGGSYDFTKNINSAPLTAVEFPNASTEYSIVFAGNDDAVMPAVILGLRDQENLYLSEDGKWNSKYIPAFIRRYPFVFSSSNEAKQFTLCIDEEFLGCNQDGIGERLFDTEGEQTQYLKTVLNFSSEYQGQFNRTQLFCKKLKELDLLEPMQAQFTLPTGEKMNLGGFQAVSRERLKKLSNEQLGELAKTDELELIYLHLQSMRNFNAMVARVPESDASSNVAKDSKKEKLSKKDMH
ncbi:MAG: SapC family protein [Methylococcales bacterium]|nr:SapC family protein [Methylococcales bacterium]